MIVFVGIAKGEGASFSINLNNNNPIQFCATSVSIAEFISIVTVGTPNINGFKISFSEGYKLNEDELVVLSHGTLRVNWSASTGALELTGGTAIQDYVTAIRSIQYKNLVSNPTLGIRKITISLNDADYLPETSHFYRFVEKLNLSWSAARAEAMSTNYYGLQGYLATVTSIGENDFIKLKTKGVGWIGASDDAVEGEWRWVTGPEGKEDGNKGLLFYITGSGPYQGSYTNWNTGEPNNVGSGEDYAHITVFSNNPSGSYKWNDLPDSGGKDEYTSKGYLIEFGGMEIASLHLSATLELHVNEIPIIDLTKIETLICGDRFTTVNIAPNGTTKFTLSSIDNKAQVIGLKVTAPGGDGIYPMLCKASNSNNTCFLEKPFSLSFYKIPHGKLNIDKGICKKYSFDASFTSIADLSKARFTWIFGGEIIADGIGLIKQNIPLGIRPSPANLEMKVEENGCSNNYEIKDIPVDPTLSVAVINPIRCQPEAFEFLAMNTETGVSYDWDFGDGKMGTGQKPTHTYENAGKYDVRVTVVTNDIKECTNTALVKEMVFAAPLPDAAFIMDNNVVYKGKATVNFSNRSSGSGSYLWNFGDESTSDLENPSHNYAVTGYRTVLLKAYNEYCSDTVSHQLLVAFDKLFPPDGFSPNAPDIADQEFLLNAEGIIPEGYHLTVLSRWNDVVFEVREEIKGWDGRMVNGTFAPAGAYVWILNYTDFLGRKHQQNGTITVVY
ncbi:MAG: PKD domain-containing protein [Mariniphaga sp.]|nr:PKD domain-containing protein [Mariniphaga sp.]